MRIKKDRLNFFYMTTNANVTILLRKQMIYTFLSLIRGISQITQGSCRDCEV